MPRKKELKPEELLELSVKRMLRGALGRLRGPERLGELIADLADKEDDSGVPSNTPESTRARMLTVLAQSLGQYGAEGPGGDLVDAESLEAMIAQHEAARPDGEGAEGGLGDDADPQ